VSGGGENIDLFSGQAGQGRRSPTVRQPDSPTARQHESTRAREHESTYRTVRRTVTVAVHDFG
jgi:hypothetical protein